jgi:hypothetical protein
MSTNRHPKRAQHVDARGRPADATSNGAASRRDGGATRRIRPISIGWRAATAFAVLLGSAVLYGLAAMSVRASMGVTSATALSDERACAVRHLIGRGGASCFPLEERQ